MAKQITGRRCEGMEMTIVALEKPSVAENSRGFEMTGQGCYGIAQTSEAKAKP